MELYVHIPFCVKKCNYCDFLSMPADDTVKKQYVQALKNEIVFYAESLPEKLETIYFGGGTPSVLLPEQLTELLDLIRSKFDVHPDAEITIEINPATIDYKGLHKLKKAGFNRLSIGLQSVQNDKLLLLGRIHTYEEFLQTYQNARQAGFQNINIDCMSALPGQSLEEYVDGLHKVVALNPEHISSYSLIIEENTPFYEQYANHKELLPDEETDRAMYHETKRILQEAGYFRYEISNYAKAGFESRHNSGYWKRVPYLGIGLGASSFIHGCRTKNISDMKQYILLWLSTNNVLQKSDRCHLVKGSITASDNNYNCAPRAINKNTIESEIENSIKDVLYQQYDEIEQLSIEDAMAEYFFLGLRMIKGVSIQRFETEFGCSVFERFSKELAELEKDGLLLINPDEDRIALTEFGMDVSNWVFEKFI